MASDQVTAAEVAEDFQASLEDLTTNDRFQINNFTVIARENTEYANEISNVLIEHINKAKPDQKLPAIYVLDSIAKNIGSPYTLFLGHRLYSTFMNAYSSVDRPTRRRLDDVLKMWAAPVPGSLDPRPVFPVETTGKIMNALHQSTAKAMAYEQQQRQEQEALRRRKNPMPGANTWRETPTPPPAAARYPPPSSYANGIQHASYPQGGPYQQVPIQQSRVPVQYPLQQSSGELGSLIHDIENLIRGAKEDLIQNLNNMEVQTKLKALLDLQQVLRSQQLPPAALQAVREQVRALQLTSRPVPPPAAATAQVSLPISTPAQIPLPYAGASTPLQYVATPAIVPPPPAATAAPHPAVSTNTLADLLSSMQRNGQTPVPTVSTPQMTRPVPAAVPIPPPTIENPLFAQLRAAGLLAGTPQAPSTSQNLPPPISQPAPAANGPVNLADLLKSVAQKTSTSAGPTIPRGERIELTSASVKVPRPHLISKLYEARPNQCTTCGKRFLLSDEGRKDKAKHLDWHFHNNQRLAESSQRGLSRSWYVDELEWIKFREAGDNLQDSNGEDSSLLGASSRKDDPKNRYVPVPSDNTLANTPCPICQEKFEVSRNEELQDFVWMDAVKIGGRVYHASCYADMKKDGGNTPARISTPDSVLGKRKAEISNGVSPNKMLRESAD